MRTHPDILSAQAITRLQGGELILKGYDNDEIADIVGVTVRCVNQWRTTLHEHNDDIHTLARKNGSGRTTRLTDEQKQITQRNHPCRCRRDPQHLSDRVLCQFHTTRVTLPRIVSANACCPAAQT